VEARFDGFDAQSHHGIRQADRFRQNGGRLRPLPRRLSHSALPWRGRIRASAGIAASLGPQEVARFDDELREMLASRFPERPFPEDPMRVQHRAFAMVCRVPLDARPDRD